MLTTEDEARKRWCPHSRRLIQLQSAFGNPVAGFSANRTTEDDAIGSCIGSACMAWRWAFTSNPITGVEKTKHGYCGLAGQAQDIIE